MLPSLSVSDGCLLGLRWTTQTRFSICGLMYVRLVLHAAQGQGGGALIALLNSLRLNVFNISCWHDFVSLVLSMRFGGLQQDSPLPPFSLEDTPVWKCPLSAEIGATGDNISNHQGEDADVETRPQTTSFGSSEEYVHSSDEGSTRGRSASEACRGKSAREFFSHTASVGEREGHGESRRVTVEDARLPPSPPHQDPFLPSSQREGLRRFCESVHRSSPRGAAAEFFRYNSLGGEQGRRADEDGEDADSWSDFEGQGELVYALEEASGGRQFLQEEKVSLLQHT